MTAMLKQNGNHDFRIAIRSKPYEPGVIFVFASLLVNTLVDDLRGACFSRHVEPINAGGRRRAPVVDDTPHRLRHGFHGVFTHRISVIRNIRGFKPIAPKLLGLNQPRLFEAAAGGKSSDSPSRLDWSHTDLALSNGHE